MLRTGFWLLPLLFGMLSSIGCATHANRLQGIRTLLYSGDVSGSLAALDERIQQEEADREVLELDRAIVELAAGRPKQAEQLLRTVRDRFDYLEQSSLPEFALAAVTDDQRLAYAGEDYEKILIRAFLALSNLMADGEDAAAYGLQVSDKQQQIIQAGADKTQDNPKLAYKRVALGAYIHGLLREETHVNYDDTARAYQKVVEWEPRFQTGRMDLERARHGRHSQRGHGVLYIFTLVGQGPYKKQVSEIPTTAALLIADRILSHTGKHTLPPTVAPVKVPKVVLTSNEIQSVQVAVDGQARGTTETITDVGRLAVQQYEAIYPRVLARAVARRVVKKGAIYASKEVIGKAKDPFVNFALDVVGVAWEATEAADTRCWGLLPEKIQVHRIELPVGDHEIGLRPTCNSGVCGSEEKIRIRISEGRNTYLLANFPGKKIVGKIVTNEPAE